MVDINNVVAGTISEFISYALWITAILAIYYFIRFVMGTEQKEEPDGEGLERIKDWIKKRSDKEKGVKEERERTRDEKSHAHRRTRLLGRGRGICARIINNCNEARDYLRRRDGATLSRARSVIGSISRDLRILKELIARAQEKLEGDKRTSLGEWYNFTEAMEELLEKGIRDNLPHRASDVAAWDAAVPAVRENFKELKTRAGAVMNALENFIENDALGSPPAAGAATRPTPPRRRPPTVGPSPLPRI